MNKKLVSYSLCFCFVIMILSTAVFAGTGDFAGTWKNVDRNTRGITTIKIKADGPNVRVHVWGKCHPKECDWGEREAYAYGRSVPSNLAASANVITAHYKEGFKNTVLVIRKRGPKKINVNAFTRFTDNRGRFNYANEYKFKRVRVQAVVPGTKPMKPAKPVPAKPILQPMDEDCISFNPSNTRVTRAQGRWKIAEGNHWMFDFGNNKAEADRSLRIIKHYRMNQSCFVGRPDPSFKYMLRSGHAPVGDIRGEDCIAFNPNNIQVKRINGRWKIVEESHWIVDFEGNEAEARKTFRIIKKYGFNKSCFVGRPDPNFQYLRR